MNVIILPMSRNFLTRRLPTWPNVALSVFGAVLLVLAFPDLEVWPLAWVALLPLMWAVARQKNCVAACVLLGWIFGTTFFFGSCWWLTYAPIHYASFPAWLAYGLMLIVALSVGLFPALFAGVLALLIRRFGSRALAAAPFVWVATEFLRYWATGNNWNAIGYSQAFVRPVTSPASMGGIYLVSFEIVFFSSFLLLAVERSSIFRSGIKPRMAFALCAVSLPSVLSFVSMPGGHPTTYNNADARVVAVQPNVPMSSLSYIELERLRQRQADLAEAEIAREPVESRLPTTVILPESPMNYMYTDDREFQQFIGDLARRNNASVLFNSAEPEKGTTKYFNSAVMVGPDGREVAEYDKIFLLPFGEAVPPPLEGILPGFVGNFAYGRKYDLLPVGDTRAGVMICFESHFGQLSRRYAADGADFLIEMTNDGYLGPTPVLRQHLANAVFRAIETDRPVIRVTNVGVTAFITETGSIIDAAPVYQEATRVWSVSKSNGSKTFYVKYGDWFAWMCTIMTIGLLILSFQRKRPRSSAFVTTDVAEARTK